MKYTVQLEYLRPAYVDIVVEADSIKEACANAIEAGHREDGWEDDYDSSSTHYVAGLVRGEHECVADAPRVHLTIPRQYRAAAILAIDWPTLFPPIERKASP